MSEGERPEEPWLEASQLSESAKLGLSPEAHVEKEYEAAREVVRGEVRDLRRRVRDGRAELQALRRGESSEDALATMLGNIERLLARISELVETESELRARRTAALETLAARETPDGQLDPQAAVAEAERLLRDTP